MLFRFARAQVMDYGKTAPRCTNRARTLGASSGLGCLRAGRERGPLGFFPLGERALHQAAMDWALYEEATPIVRRAVP